jgi:serine/threonine-protein kinase
VTQRLIPAFVILIALLFGWREVQQGKLAYHPEPHTRNALIATPPRVTPQPRVLNKVIKPEDFVRAVETARDGAILELGAGEYRLVQGLEITRSITLIGAGRDKTRIVSDDEIFVLKFDASGTFTARDLSFEHDGSQKADVVVIENGSFEFERCQFSGGIRNPEQDPTTGDGLWVRHKARGRVSQSVLSDNGLHGLELQGSANLTLQGNTFERNKENGLAFFDNTSGVARGNTSRKNGLHGISVAEQASPRLENNIFELNTEVGLRYSGTASGAATGNTVGQNGLSGIVINDSARPSLEGNRLVGNGSYGLYISENAHPNLGQNDLSGNKLGNLKDLRSGKAKP